MRSLRLGWEPQTSAPAWEEWRFSAALKKQEIIPATTGHQEPTPREKHYSHPNDCHSDQREESVVTFSANEPNSVLHRQEWEKERLARAKKTEGCPILNALFAFRVGTHKPLHHRGRVALQRHVKKNKK